MNILIEIDSTNVRERNIKSERGTFTVRDQTGWLRLPGKRYPKEMVISLDEGQEAYSDGTYRLLEESVTIEKFNRISFQRSSSLERMPHDKLNAAEDSQ